ncbi:MAG: hypothetical protein M0Z88_09625 [Actinomycetota bacterium]|nr:hypothetical protein [Actinomycetota bacterium]
MSVVGDLRLLSSALSPIRLAQAVMSNWAIGEMPGVERGYRIGLASWSNLGQAAVAELSPWLQFTPNGDDDVKQVFTQLRDGRLVWARLRPLAGQVDDLGRRAYRYWGHALIAGDVPRSLRGGSPLLWWDDLPFYSSLDEAKASVCDERNALPVIDWEPTRKPVPLEGPPDLDPWLCDALNRVRDEEARRSPIVVSRRVAGGPLIAEPYRLVDPSRWGLLPVDDAFDGVLSGPGRRYWVIGRSSISDDRAAELQMPSSLGVTERWALDLLRDGKWSIAVNLMARAEETEDSLRSGTLDLVGLPPGDGIRATFLKNYGVQIVTDEVGSRLAAESWPPELVEAVLLGFESIPLEDVTWTWQVARAHDNDGNVTSSDLMGLFGLMAKKPSTQASEACRAWRRRDQFPLTSACLIVWAHVQGGTRGTTNLAFSTSRHGGARGAPSLGDALAHLDVGVLERWVRWVFQVWPGPPPELVLPRYLPSADDAWRESIDVVLRLADEGWLHWRVEAGDQSYAKLATQWARQLKSCGAYGHQCARWIEDKIESGKQLRRAHSSGRGRLGRRL